MGLSCEIPIPWIETTSATNRLAQHRLQSSPRELGCSAAGAGLPLCRAEHGPAFHLPPALGCLCGPGGALLGVMFVMFPGSPSRKNILETQRFPFCQHTNEPQTEPTSKRPANEPVSPASPPRFQEGPNDAVVLQRRQLCFWSPLSGKKKKPQGEGGREQREAGTHMPAQVAMATERSSVPRSPHRAVGQHGTQGLNMKWGDAALRRRFSGADPQPLRGDCGGGVGRAGGLGIFLVFPGTRRAGGAVGMGVGKQIRWREHRLDRPLALQRAFVLPSQSFQLCLELPWWSQGFGTNPTSLTPPPLQGWDAPSLPVPSFFQRGSNPSST